MTEVRNHPRHYLSPLLRQSIYRGFGHPFDPQAMRARGLLALITARRGLDQGHTGDWELIHLGEAVLAGMAVRAEACEWHESWSYRDIVNWESDASTMALEEVAGAIWCANQRHLPDSRSIDKTGAIYDTAAMVAVIEARDKHSFYLLPARLAEFWEWWLNEAIPAAWAASRPELVKSIVS